MIICEKGPIVLIGTPSFVMSIRVLSVNYLFTSQCATLDQFFVLDIQKCHIFILLYLIGQYIRP